MGPVSNYYSIGFYDADKKFIENLSIAGTGNIETYYITLDEKYDEAVYVRGSWARGPNLQIEDTYDFIFIIRTQHFHHGKLAAGQYPFDIPKDSLGSCLAGFLSDFLQKFCYFLPGVSLFPRLQCLIFKQVIRLVFCAVTNLTCHQA